jgi:hypothetical protein
MPMAWQYGQGMQQWPVVVIARKEKPCGGHRAPLQTRSRQAKMWDPTVPFCLVTTHVIWTLFEALTV